MGVQVNRIDSGGVVVKTMTAGSVYVPQLPMRDQSIPADQRMKAMSEIGPTTFEAGKPPHVDGVPVDELHADMAASAEQARADAREAAEAERTARAKARTPGKAAAKAPDTK